MSEVLLQRTNASQVNSVYDEILAQLHSPTEILNKSQRELEKVFYNLGLRKRAKYIKKMAKAIIKNYDGRIPDNERMLLSLPLVGKYSANALLCFAFGKRRPILDPNVYRIYNRVFGISSIRLRPTHDMELWEEILCFVPKKNFRDYNFALLDFASKVCTISNPKCYNCPMKRFCKFYRLNIDI